MQLHLSVCQYITVHTVVKMWSVWIHPWCPFKLYSFFVHEQWIRTRLSNWALCVSNTKTHRSFSDNLIHFICVQGYSEYAIFRVKITFHNHKNSENTDILGKCYYYLCKNMMLVVVYKHVYIHGALLDVLQFCLFKKIYNNIYWTVLLHTSVCCLCMWISL